jgi:hypothetical protein
MTQEVELKFEAPQPEQIAKSIREGVMNNFIEQLDVAIAAKSPFMDALVQSGNITVGPDNKVLTVSEYLQNVMHTSVDEVTSKIGFCMVRNAHMFNITPEGSMAPVEVRDVLRATSKDGITKYVTAKLVLTVEPSTEEETAMAEKRNAVVS